MPAHRARIALTLDEAHTLLQLCRRAVPSTPDQLEVAARLSVLLAVARAQGERTC